MNQDKITAMWEEDGDLMRLKDFFTYVYQDNNLKERIKSKTIEKLLSSDDSNSSLITKSEISSEQCDKGGKHTSSIPNENTMKQKNSFNLITEIKKQFKGKRSTLKKFIAAAVVICAVSIGSISVLLEGDSPLRVGSLSNKVSETQDASFSNKGFSGQKSAPKSDLNLFSSSAGAENRDVMDTSGVLEEGITLQKSKLEADEEVQQKIIYVLETTLKTDNVLATIDAVQDKIKSIGGYIAESAQNNNQDQISAFLSLKVPATEFESFKNDLAQFGTISNQHLFTDDVSRQYFDVETRLRSWEAQEKRYLEILQQAKTVEEILKIEDSLANVRREMESLKGQLKYWDNRVQYSEIRINIYSTQSNFIVDDPWQPVSMKSTLIAAKNAIVKSLSFLWNSLNHLVVLIGYAIPVGVIFTVIWFIYRKYKK